MGRVALSKREVLGIAATAAATWGATFVGFLAAQPRPALASLGSSPSPPTVMLGLGVGVMLVARFGRRHLVGVFVGSFLAHFVGTILPLTFALAIVKTLATWAGAKIIVPRLGAGPLRATFAAASGAVVTSVIVAMASFAAVVIIGRAPAPTVVSDGVAAFFGVFLSGLIGLTMAAPFGLGLAARRGPVHPVHAAVATIGAAVATAATLRYPLGVPALFLPFPFVLYAIARGGRYVAEVLVCCIALALLIGAVKGFGPLPMTGATAEILHMQPVVALLTLSSLLMTGYAATAPIAVPGVVLATSWAIAALIAGYFDTVERERDRGSFDRTVEAAQAALNTRMATYEDALRAGVGLFAASQDVTRAEWGSFVKELGLLDRYPGINSFGVAVSVRRGEEADTLAIDMRREDPTFEIRDVAEPDPSYPERFVMIFREPISTTPGVMGLDFATDPVRRAAAVKARETKAAALSRVVRLARGEPARYGFLMFLPTPDGHGWVYASFEMASLFGSAFGTHPRPFRAEVHDADAPVGTPIYVDGPESTKGYSSLARTVTFTVAQQALTVVFRPSATFTSGRSAAGAFAIASGGLIALLLAAVTGSLQMIGLRAGVLAEERTRELAARERLLQALMQAAPVGIFLTDAAGRCTYVNDTLAALLGLPPATALGNGWLAALPPSYRVQPVEHRLVQPDGNEIWVVTRAIAMREDGVVSGYVGTVQDLTEIKKQQRELIATSKMSSLGEMAGGIAHEINNPLTIIQGRADQLLRWIQRGGVEPERVKAVAQDIDVTVHRIAKIVKGLRVFARDAERDPFEETPLSQVVDGTLVLCQERFKLHGVDLRVVVEPGLTLECRPVQLSQVLLNLLNNAFDAVETLQSKWVEVHAARVGETVALAITDSGAGLPPHVAARVMQPFFTTKAVGKGTGLGLSIAKGLVEDHGGTLVYDAASPHTRFVVTLPVSQPVEDT